jgi:phospholipid/cholesterol/gamma-HCH transport system ATP-binding protein
MALLLNGKFSREGKFEDVFNTNDDQVNGFYNYNFIK